MVASSGGYADVVSMLLKHNAQVDLKNAVSIT